jgi:hypothetical protein
MKLAQEEFIKELKALLEKYDAHIAFEMHDSSNTHGIYDPRIVVAFRTDRKRFEYDTVVLRDGYSVDKSDL